MQRAGIAIAAGRTAVCRAYRIGSDRIGSDRIGSDRIGSDRMGECATGRPVRLHCRLCGCAVYEGEFGADCMHGRGSYFFARGDKCEQSAQPKVPLASYTTGLAT